MTRATNARIAGFTFLIYIAVGITSMVLTARATSGTGVAAQLATIAQHATDVRLTILLTLAITCRPWSSASRYMRSRESRIVISRCWA